MFNKIIIAGNLTKDPEMRYTTAGVPVVTFSVAVNSRYKQNGETKEEALFMDTIVFGKQAENCKEYLSKGSPVLIEGRLRERRWEQDGIHRSKIEIMSKDVRFLPSNKSKSGAMESAVTEDEDSDNPF